jgi:hypothetical protein
VLIGVLIALIVIAGAAGVLWRRRAHANRT